MRLEEIMDSVEYPVLLISSQVGKGNYSTALALGQRGKRDGRIYHCFIEELLPQQAIREDLRRYKFISNHLRWLLHLIYRVPFFYYRKYLRERLRQATDVRKIQETIGELGVKTVICVSHRPTFWVSLAKRRSTFDCALWGVLTEFGTNLGWRFVFWDVIDGFLSVVPKSSLRLPFPEHLAFREIELPCGREFASLAGLAPQRDQVLLVAGYWGQMSFRKTVRLIQLLLRRFSRVRITVVCGTNAALFQKISDSFKAEKRIVVCGAVENLSELMRSCASVLTKPGFSTVIEAYVAGRKIFLLPGMPVAEDHNAAYARAHLGAEWFSVSTFTRWYEPRIGAS